MNINDREIGTLYPPYIIAEISANHGGQIENAFKLIDQAKLAGADAVKLQTYTPDTITLKSDSPQFLIKDGLWAGKTLWDLYNEAHTPFEWHEQLFNYARKSGITIFSSPFDKTAVDLLEDLNTPAYKIASFEAIDLPLISYVASTKKPIIISTGIANLEEIEEAIDTAISGGAQQLAILHCVSGYPAPAADYNLATVTDLAAKFNCIVGLSDHTLSNNCAIASVALGASIVEKHFTLDRSGGGPDDCFSLEVEDLKSLVLGCRETHSAIGVADYSLKESEKLNKTFRRSLYFVRDLPRGHFVSARDIRSVRPGFGLAPKHFEKVIGQKLNRNVVYGEPVRLEVLEL